MTLLCFNDHADGKAYLKLVHTDMKLLWQVIPFLTVCDHVCLVSDEIYLKYGDTDLSTYAPYAITIEMGEKVNVNNL